MPETEIILVGNGSALKGSGLGAAIDAHNIVCRMNNFSTKGHEVDCGSKTDWFIRRSCSDVQMLPKDSISKVINMVTYCELSKQMAEVALGIKKYYGDRCFNIGVDVCRDIAEEIGLVYPTERATVGALAIGYITKYMQLPVTIVGFGGEIGKHYYPRGMNSFQHHAWDKEAAWIQNLLSKGKIHLLGGPQAKEPPRTTSQCRTGKPIERATSPILKGEA